MDIKVERDLVVVDGKEYLPQGVEESKAFSLLNDLYCALWTEAYYAAFNDETRDFARPLADKMTMLNSILHFKR